MSTARLLAIAAVVTVCLPLAESSARCRLFGRRCSRLHARTYDYPVAAPAPGHGPGEICRSGVIIDFLIFAFYSCVECDTGADSIVMADSGLPVDDDGAPCDGDPPGACDPITFLRLKVEGVYIAPKYETSGVPLDSKPKNQGGIKTVDVRYDRSGTEFYARVYLIDHRVIALPISKDQAKDPIPAEVKPHRAKVDVLTATLKDGTKIKGPSIREQNR